MCLRRAGAAARVCCILGRESEGWISMDSVAFFALVEANAKCFELDEREHIH